jgi:hypothetical protein
VAPEAWSSVALGGREAVAARRARALSDEGDDPRITDRVGPPVSERETTTETDKRRSWAAAGLENKGGGQAKNKEKVISELKLDF